MPKPPLLHVSSRERAPKLQKHLQRHLHNAKPLSLSPKLPKARVVDEKDASPGECAQGLRVLGCRVFGLRD